MQRLAILLPMLLVAFVSVSCGLFVAAYHPLSPALAMLACLAATVFCVLIANGWLLLLPALLPVVDLAPWTGWISLEEFDFVVLGAAAGTYLRNAGWFSGGRLKPSLSLVVIGSAFAVSIVVALGRGVTDAGGFHFGFFQGYEGPMNSLRLAKPFFMAALFVPFMKAAVMDQDAKGRPLLVLGMTFGLGLASLATVWERLAFTDLLNFSADYRTTALFWEMHVGGAALDGFLALTMPFAVMFLLREKRIPLFIVAGLLLGLGVYSCLTTFSRGVYAAEFVSIAVMGLLLIRNMSASSMRDGKSVSGWAPGLRGLAWAVLGLLCSYWVFRHGGYRALGAVLGVFAITVAGGPILRMASPGKCVVALIFGVILGVISVAAALAFSKGVYWIYGGLALMTAALIIQARRLEQMEVLALAFCVALFFAAANVSWFWGGFAALTETAGVLLILLVLAAWNAFGKQPLWGDGLRSQALLIVAVGIVSFVVVIFGGGKYMENRFATTEHDFGYRIQHWRAGLEPLRTPWDWWLGKGLGRFPTNFFLGSHDNEFPGSYRVGRENDNDYLTLFGPRFQIGYGEVLRISQRIPLSQGLYYLEFESRAAKNVELDMAICKKHLIYKGACAYKSIRIQGSDDALGWQRQSVELDARKLEEDSSAWYAPQLVVFTIALDTLGARIDVDNIKLLNALGQNVLSNGEFSDEMARWFFTSDHHHMPWHMKNLFLHVLFEQGLLGLVPFIALIVTALAKVGFGRNRNHPLAPALAAAIIGFMVVGLFDSLLDVPRVAFLFFLLTMMAIQSGRKTPY